MKFVKQVILDATPGEIWELVADIPALASCIPGLETFEMQDATHFSSIVSIKVGAVKPRFSLSTALLDLHPPSSLTVISEGADRALGSQVRHHQTVTLEPAGAGTSVSIDADIRISGRIATFGQRVIASKAEDFATEVIANVERVLADRRIEARDRSEDTTDPG